jgi:hypothetical protein
VSSAISAGGSTVDTIAPESVRKAHTIDSWLGLQPKSMHPRREIPQFPALSRNRIASMQDAHED